MTAGSSILAISGTRPAQRGIPAGDANAAHLFARIEQAADEGQRLVVRDARSKESCKRRVREIEELKTGCIRQIDV